MVDVPTSQVDVKLESVNAGSWKNKSLKEEHLIFQLLFSETRNVYVEGG
jgi:hypothetical protein